MKQLAVPSFTVFREPRAGSASGRRPPALAGCGRFFAFEPRRGFAKEMPLGFAPRSDLEALPCSNDIRMNPSSGERRPDRRMLMIQGVSVGAAANANQ